MRQVAPLSTRRPRAEGSEALGWRWRGALHRGPHQAGHLTGAPARPARRASLQRAGHGGPGARPRLRRRHERDPRLDERQDAAGSGSADAGGASRRGGRSQAAALDAGRLGAVDAAGRRARRADRDPRPPRRRARWLVRPPHHRRCAGLGGRHAGDAAGEAALGGARRGGAALLPAAAHGLGQVRLGLLVRRPRPAPRCHRRGGRPLRRGGFAAGAASEGGRVVGEVARRRGGGAAARDGEADPSAVHREHGEGSLAVGALPARARAGQQLRLGRVRAFPGDAIDQHHRGVPGRDAAVDHRPHRRLAGGDLHEAAHLVARHRRLRLRPNRRGLAGTRRRGHRDP
mmetsp:Transcript_69126/g.200149  ORF Transcript_69126/g.200149 Transcript_69126/m.200149 type:complete len:344 (+) Transcript_69126:658-1689(+)